MVFPLLSTAALVPLLFSPITRQYRIDITGMRQYERERSADDTSAIGGDFHVVAFVSETTRDSAGTEVAHVVIDSLTCSGTRLLSMAYDPSVGPASRGAWFDVVVRGGVMTELPAPSIRNPATSVVAQMSGALFAPERSHYAAGDRWSDTADLHRTTDNYAEGGPTITRWQVQSSAPDSTLLNGDVTGVVSVTGRIMATGLVLGKHVVVLAPGGFVRRAMITSTQQFLLANQGATDARNGHGSTTIDITWVR